MSCFERYQLDRVFDYYTVSVMHLQSLILDSVCCINSVPGPSRSNLIAGPRQGCDLNSSQLPRGQRRRIVWGRNGDAGARQGKVKEMAVAVKFVLF